MERKSKSVYRFFAIGLAVLFCASILTDSAWAARRRPHPPAPRPAPRYHPPRHHVRISPILPLGFALLTIAGMEYYYNRGIYYKRLPDGYVVTKPPLGAVVVQLPSGYIMFRSGGVEYFYYNDVYYNRVPSGYVVVEPPYVASTSDSIVKQQSALPVTELVKSMAPMLNVRSGPGTNHPIVSQIPQGTIVEIHGSSPEWLFVKLPSGEFGWVMGKFTVSESVPQLAPAEG